MQNSPAEIQRRATLFEAYLARLEELGYSVSHRTRIKSVIKHFCQWLIEEKEVMKHNFTSAIVIKTRQQLVPRFLSPDQRFVLRNLVEKADDLRDQVLFA